MLRNGVEHALELADDVNEYGGDTGGATATGTATTAMFRECYRDETET